MRVEKPLASPLTLCQFWISIQNEIGIMSTTLNLNKRSTYPRPAASAHRGSSPYVTPGTAQGFPLGIPRAKSALGEGYLEFLEVALGRYSFLYL